MDCPSKRSLNGCPVTYALDSFGDRWSLLIIRDILLRGFSTYGDFLDGGEGISTNILADRLKFLEAQGIINKTPDTENRRRIIYSLTEKGFDLAPVIFDLFLWSAQYDPETKAPKEMVERMDKDRAALLADIRKKVLGPPV
jgi:DNA-binding HxlR family transcriptional regulator